MSMSETDTRGVETRTDPDWKEVDAQLRRLAKQSSGLDWEIGRALLLARHTRAWERLAHASLFEYVERLFGYSSRVTAERLRVAAALEELPALDTALRAGERSWSAVREVSRVAVSDTESEWLDFSKNKTVRELEQAVSGLVPGDRPGDPPDPHLMRRIIRLDVSPECWALFKDAMARIRRAAPDPLSEEEAFLELCRRSLTSTSTSDTAPYQVLLTLCEDCGRTWQDAGGESVELPPEVGERALCDAQILGVHDERASAEVVSPPPAAADGTLTHTGPAGECSGAMSGPTVDSSSGSRAQGATTHTHVGHGRTARTVRGKSRRDVIRRDNGKCQVPGCRNHVWLEVHHLRPRSEGGSHAHWNLLVLCGTHHAALHHGFLVIEGSANANLRFFHADATPYGEAPRPVDVDSSADAFAALRGLGFSETESRQALAAARTHVGAGASAEALITAALRLRSLDRAA